MKEIINTPILERFRRLELAVPGHFNQSVMLDSNKRINAFALKAAFGILCQYHEVLRSVWNGERLLVRDVLSDNPFYFEEHNLSGSANVEGDILPFCESLQSSADIAKGPMMRVALFQLPEKDVVFVVIHHLVVDGVSWRIIIDDLNRIYATLLQGKISVGLPKRTCSFAQYAQALNDYAGSDGLKGTESYWSSVVDKISRYESGMKTDTSLFVKFRLDGENSKKITGKGYGNGFSINALLLTALSRAWKDVTGQTFLSVAMEGHGREPFVSGPLPLDRLVGWFTSIFPVALLYEERGPGEHLAAVQAMLDSIPDKGLGYGILAYTAHKEHLLCNPLLTFNYLGSFEEAISGSIFTINNTLPQGNPVSLKNKADTPLTINCAVDDGFFAGTLAYDSGVFDDCRAQALCDAFVGQLITFNGQ